jgi:hypothetical protein
MENSGLSWCIADVGTTTIGERLSRFPCERANPLAPMATRDAMPRHRSGRSVRLERANTYIAIVAIVLLSGTKANKRLGLCRRRR